MGYSLALRAVSLSVVGALVGTLALGASPASAQEGARSLTRPGDADAERPFELGAPGTTLRVIGAPMTPVDYEHRATERLRTRRRSVFVASLLGTTLSFGLAAAVGHRRGSQCQEDAAFHCDRERRSAAFTTWVLATPLIVPLAAWLGGRLSGSRGRYLPTFLTTAAFMLVSGLIAAVTTSIADSDAGRGVGLGVSAMLPAFAAFVGNGASDAEQRHFR